MAESTSNGGLKPKWPKGFFRLFRHGAVSPKFHVAHRLGRSNVCPENATANNHDFQMHNFEETACCKACSMMLRYGPNARPAPAHCPKSKLSPSSPHVLFCHPLRGIFFQGYRCTRCKMAAHKECLGRLPACGRNSGRSLPVKVLPVAVPPVL